MTTATLTIGGSEAAAALGVDPYRSRVSLYLEKRGEIPPSEPGEAARWGTLLEPVILMELREQGYEAWDRRDEVHPQNAPHPFMHAHLDGSVMLDGKEGVLEIKTVGLRGAHEWADGQAPVPYIIQCHHYMIVTGLDRALLAVLIGGQHLEVRELYRDDHLCEFIVKGEEEFVRMVEAGTPPPPDGSTSTTEALKHLYGLGDPAAVHDFSPEEYAVVEEYRSLRDAAKAGAKHLEKLEQEIKFAMENATVGLYGGKPEVRWSEIKSNRCDTKALKAAHPDVYESFVRPTSYRRFSA